MGNPCVHDALTNYCFYFRDNKQCKFCEIEGTFKNKISSTNMIKRANNLAKYIADTANMNTSLNHLAITSGNLIDYDGTSKYFLKLSSQLYESGVTKDRFSDVLITLIPPDDENLIWDLSQGIFNKIYYPIEVFDETRFKEICPGKYEFGREKLLKSLEIAVKAFGRGNVYTNFVYGIQSPLVNGAFNHELENQISIEATKALLNMGVIPAFTVYHYGGYNSIGNIPLSPEGMSEFFIQWGREVLNSGIIPAKKSSVLFGDLSLSNTMFNEGFRLALNENLRG